MSRRGKNILIGKHLWECVTNKGIMKNFVLISALAAAATLTSAHASNFGGVSGGLNLNTISTTTGLKGEVGGDSASLDGVGQQSWNGSAQIAYGFVTSPFTVISVGATYGLGKSKAGSFAVDAEDDLGNSVVANVAIRMKDQLSVYVEPGFLLSRSTLLYGKISYEKAKIVGSVSGESVGSSSESTSLKGSGFGFGLRTMLDKSSYIQVEVKQVAYRKIPFFEGSNFKSKSTMGSIGLGYKF